ncbi:MAG: hypothetical protein Q8900_02810 [Bacillota bacterium]|nr:hypothetical protein [Bacillota bacterium]
MRYDKLYNKLYKKAKNYYIKEEFKEALTIFNKCYKLKKMLIA